MVHIITSHHFQTIVQIISHFQSTHIRHSRNADHVRILYTLGYIYASLLGKKLSDPNPVLLHLERILSIPSNPNRKDSGDLQPCGKWFSRRRRPHSWQNIYGYCIGRNLNDVITAANMNTILLRRKSGCLWTTSLLPTSARPSCCARCYQACEKLIASVHQNCLE